MIKQCLICKREFYVKPYIIKKGYGKYCSQKCYGKFLKNKIPWNKNKKMPQITGKNNPNWKGERQYNEMGQVLS